MAAASEVDSKAWVTALRDAIATRDEGLYRRKLMQFLDTRQGGAFAEAVVRRPAAMAVMRRSFRALAVPLGLKHPDDLLSWLHNDDGKPQVVKEGARDVVAMALPYFRFARGWARTAHKDSSFAIALALMFFEPVLQLCEPAADTAAQEATAAAPREATPSFAHLTQRA